MKNSDIQLIELYAKSFELLHKNGKVAIANAETGKIIYASTTFMNTLPVKSSNIVGKDVNGLPESARKLLISENILSPSTGKVIGKICSL